MRKTEKYYWRNGYQVRGKNFKTLTLSFFNIGIMLSGRVLPYKLSIFLLTK